MTDAPKTTARVFISHSSTDKSFALLTADALRKRDLSPWIDSEQIEAGENIIERVGDGLRTMDVLTVIASKASVTSGWVAEELNFGMRRSIKDKHGQPAILQFFYQRLRHADPDARSHAAHALGEIASREPEILDLEEIERAVAKLTEMGDRDALKQTREMVSTVGRAKRDNSRYRYGL